MKSVFLDIPIVVVLYGEDLFEQAHFNNHSDILACDYQNL